MAKPTLPKNNGTQKEKVVKKARIQVPVTERPTKRTRVATPPPPAAAKPNSLKTTGLSSQSSTFQTLPKSKGKGKGKPKATQDEPTPLPSTFKVVAGSYEKLLYGLDGSTSLNTETGALEYHLKPIFIFPAHVSCIKAVAASPQGGKWLATGSADEIIKIWDLKRRKEIGGLMHHEGSITHLSFPSRSYLLSASEDGTMCLFRARDWAVLRALKGHKGRVNAVAVHPSGKVALTVGKDRTLRMWDLMRGKGVASMKIGKEGESAQWSSDGSLFAVQSGSSIDIYSPEMDLLHIINHPSRLHDVRFCKRVNGQGDLLLVAAEDKKVSIYSLSEDRSQDPTLFAQLVGHENRVKEAKTLQLSLPAGYTRESTCIVATASSDGKIHVYDMADVPAATAVAETTTTLTTTESTTPLSKEPIQISPVAQYDTNGTRLTCITLADGDSEETQLINGKRKREEEQEAAEENDDSEDDDDDDDDDEGDVAFGEGWEDEDEGEDEDEEDSD